MTTEGLSRRNALAGAATVGLALPLLAACGGGGGTKTEAPASGDLAATTDVPVGGGTVFADRKVVVTQPSAGDFRGFSATCTHQGCTVANVEEGTINCPCHGSRFSIEDGSNVAGPSGSPAGSIPALAGVPLAVKGRKISLT